MRVVLTFSLLTLAILALWATGDETAPAWRRNVWGLLVFAACGAAWMSGILYPLGATSVALVAVLAWGFSRAAPMSWKKLVFGVALLVVAAGLMIHALPGFSNPRAITSLRITPDAFPYTLFLNFDKTVAGIFLLGWCHARMNRAAEWRAMFVIAAPWAVGLFVLTMMISLVAGYVRFEPKLPAIAPLWMWANLFLTCVAEEAICRALIQNQLQQALKSFPGGRWLALVVAAVLFGLAHQAGGPIYVALATLAGAGYGYIYQRTGRIEASILTHFTLNTVHFFLFTYPALQR